MLALNIDGGGYPILGDFSVPSGSVIVRRYASPSFQMTDFVSGPAGHEFTTNEVVAAKPSTLGRIKLLFRADP